MKKEVKDANIFGIYYSLKTKVRVMFEQFGNSVLDDEIFREKKN